MSSRRSFIKESTLASTSVMVPSFLKKSTHLPSARSRSEPILIVIQLSGGNDGLNTIVPFEDDHYYRKRPTLSINPRSVHRLNESLGINSALESLLPIYEQGQLCVLNSVGYPNPDRSHFRSMDYWQSGQLSDEMPASGWLGRYLDSDCTRCHTSYHGIEISDHLSLAMRGEVREGFAMRGPEKLDRIIGNPFLRKIGRQHKANGDSDIHFLYKTMIDVQESAAYLSRKARSLKSKFAYPNHSFGEGMRQIAELISADTSTRIYYLSLPGFDTHVYQRARQNKLLNIYSSAVSTFIKDLKSQRLFDDVLIVTFSEFGRRVQENGSQGTDHGAANVMFLMGDRLATPGIYNPAPSLTDLDNGDLIYEIDFRSVYSSIIDNWLGGDSQKILGSSPSLPKPIL